MVPCCSCTVSPLPVDSTALAEDPAFNCGSQESCTVGTQTPPRATKNGRFLSTSSEEAQVLGVEEKEGPDTHPHPPERTVTLEEFSPMDKPSGHAISPVAWKRNQEPLYLDSVVPKFAESVVPAEWMKAEERPPRPRHLQPTDLVKKVGTDQFRNPRPTPLGYTPKTCASSPSFSREGAEL